MMTTAFVFAPAPGHTLENHPENGGRLAGMLDFLEEGKVLGEMRRLEPHKASEAVVQRVHTHGHLARLEGLSRRGGGRVDADTYVTRESYELAMLAAGSVNAVVSSVVSGETKNGLALVRPPGHHAGQDRAEGFCLLNNVAVAARHAQAQHGVERLLIVDFDVHHGNGTQQIFYEDGSVLFVSLHMYSSFFYPGTGGPNEVGSGKGRGQTVNIPFPPGVGDAGYSAAIEQILIPKATAFQPELILVSAGFDAHWRDPLAASGLSLAGYDNMVGSLLELANDFCGGRIVFVLEGGYFQQVLSNGVLNLCNALVGRAERSDPLGPYPRQERDVNSLLAILREIHLRS